MKYAKDNPYVEAIRWTNEADNFSQLIEWTGGRARGASPLVWEQSGYKPKHTDLELQTPDGVVICQLGTWILKHADGVFYPVSDGCFKRLYSPA